METKAEILAWLKSSIATFRTNAPAPPKTAWGVLDKVYHDADVYHGGWCSALEFVARELESRTSKETTPCS